MAAEIDLMCRSEPAQIPFPIEPGFDKGCLGKIVLLRNRKHQVIRQPVVKYENGCGISGEQPVGKGIDLIHAHGATPLTLCAAVEALRPLAEDRSSPSGLASSSPEGPLAGCGTHCSVEIDPQIVGVLDTDTES
jgi:hypothetical protein